MYTRECPSCNAIMQYSSKAALIIGTKTGSTCRICTSKRTGFTQRYATKGNNTGINNNFYGKKHHKDTKDKISKANTGICRLTEEQKKIASTNMSGSGNRMYNKTITDVWIEKYGKKKAQELRKRWQKKLSDRNSGKNNPMYGKPSPQGSGNGWKGWYKDIYFRSLRELSYMIQLDCDCKKWTANLGLRIPYIFNGRDRTYTPDFFVENTYIEIKPKRLQKTPLVLAKIKAIKKYCKINKLKFKIIDYPIDILAIRQNINNNNIVFDRKYLERFEEYEKSCHLKGSSVKR